MASCGQAAVRQPACQFAERTSGVAAVVRVDLAFSSLCALPKMLGFGPVGGVADLSHLMPPAATQAAEPAVHRDYTAVIAAIPVIVVVALALAAAAASLAATGCWKTHRALAGPAGAPYGATASAKAALPVAHELR